MRHKNILIFFSLFIISIFGTLSFYYGFYLIKIDKINMDVTVGEKIGFNADTDALHFGTLYSGAESTRSLFIKNSNKFPIIVTIKNMGEFSNWIELENNNIFLNKNQNTSILYRIKTPHNTNHGEYKGTSIIYIKRKLI
jgi:hypothetical protein